MRTILGILSFCMAGLLAYHIGPAVQQVLIPCWLQGKSSGGFLQLQLGPFLLEEPQICMLVAGFVVLVIVLTIAGIYAFTSRDTKA